MFSTEDLFSVIDPNALWVFSGAALLGFSAGLLGCFPFLRKRALVGDVLAHAALPGVTTAFLLFQVRSLPVLLTGAALSCVLAYACVEVLVRRSRIKEDSAFAIVLSLSFALGIFQLTIIQRQPLAAQAGLDTFLFGQASALVGSDVQLLVVIAVVLLAFVGLLFRAFKYTSFDPLYCKASGMPVWRYDLLLGLLIVIAVVVGIQLVGVVLAAAMLLIPPAAARYWTDSLRTMLFIAGSTGGFAGLFGATISYLVPRMPTGPWMVVGCAAVFLISMVFAPRRGMGARIKRHSDFQRRIEEENILRSIYLLTHADAGPGYTCVDSGQILQHRQMPLSRFERACSRLERKQLVRRVDSGISLSESGLAYAEKLTRLHRLWELYLAERTNIASDHVHADAEEVEHILTADLEAKIRAELSEASHDPHGQRIPEVSDA